MRRPSSTISRRGYPFSAILTSPPERGVDAICRSCLLSRPPSRGRSAPSPGEASPVNECREKPQTCEADVNSGLPGMSWAINVWHDDETGLDRLTARLQQQLRPAPNALCGTLPGKASGYVWIAMSGDKQSCSVEPQFSTCRHRGVPAGWSYCDCRRWIGSMVESHDSSQRPLVDSAFALSSPHMPATLSLRRARVRTLACAAAIRSFAASAVSRPGKHDTTLTQPTSCI